ncbi:unnamed protein product, partial [Pylaiella littoralis]
GQHLWYSRTTAQSAASPRPYWNMNECDIEYPPCECDEPMETSFPVGMQMRPMEPGDLNEVKRLHEQCFPVRYDMAFYENVVRGFIARGKGNAKEPLYTQVAVVPSPASAAEVGRDRGGGGGGSGDEYPRRYHPHGDERGSGGAGMTVGGGSDEVESQGGGSAVLTPPGTSRRRPRDDVAHDWAAGGGGGGAGVDCGGGGTGGGGVPGRRDNIVGLITCQIMPLDRCRDQERLGLQPTYVGLGGVGGAAHTEVVYILTLGTETSYRRQGIGRALLRRCIWLSRQEESIGAVYLHVITTNPPAHRFYESEGFVQVCRISEYYRIDGELYDCFLYALFVNGAQPPGEWGWGIQVLSRRLRSIISFFRRTLGHVPEEGKLAAAVAAAGSSSTSEQDLQQHHHHHHQQQQQQRGPEDMEQDEEQASCCSPTRRTTPPLVAAAAAAGAVTAAYRRHNDTVADSGGAVAAGAAAASALASAARAGTGAGAAPVQPSGRMFAWSPHGAQRQPSPPPAAVQLSGVGNGAPRKIEDQLVFSNRKPERLLPNGVVVAASRAGGASPPPPPPTVTVWDAGASGVGGWG